MPYQVRIKICGVTTADDARQAAELGADTIGLNFYPGSVRCVAAETARRILQELPPFVAPVGVFAVLPMRDVLTQVQMLPRLNLIQWHGTNHEIIDCSPYSLIPAFAVRDAGHLQVVHEYLDACRQRSCLPLALLLDGHAPGQHGGTGQQAPWHLLESFRPGLPIILAGGLTPDNVAEAVRRVRPYAVDVASGVERAPGRKDAEKMRRFIANARAAAAGL
jgi:phosphoribosylanthranilate isomerase